MTDCPTDLRTASRVPSIKHGSSLIFLFEVSHIQTHVVLDVHHSYFIINKEKKGNSRKVACAPKRKATSFLETKWAASEALQQTLLIAQVVYRVRDGQGQIAGCNQILETKKGVSLETF